ncbi:hypothetical protein [Halioxenophilus sp. WMMB6]|uniref:hypothetical protein n=1 Tax=Halioxenophilus sp. WMMB6 TaxID=3073815 RepID=UPI00295ED25F|nr:hypothetical protein [Halioxenophilus sp. WMMB6]
MQFTKPMIDLVYEIRRRIRAELKAEVKLANPELLSMLVRSFHEDKPDAVCRALIKELMALAGGEWPVRLEDPASVDAKRMVVGAYRGTVSHEEPKVAAPAGGEAGRKPVRIYRGRVISD